MKAVVGSSHSLDSKLEKGFGGHDGAAQLLPVCGDLYGEVGRLVFMKYCFSTWEMY
jgi:hypothetical protein